MSTAVSSIESNDFAAGVMPGRLMNLETKLQRLASHIVNNPGASAEIVSSVNEVSFMLKPFESLKDINHEPVQIEALVSAVRNQLSRVHQLLETALAFQSGMLLSTKPVEETYTPDGKWLTAAAGANLSVEA